MKFKGICKKFGVAAMACFGIFAFTGCSSGITEEHYDKIMQELADIKEENNNLKDLISELEIAQLKDNAWQLYLNSRSNFLTNSNGARNNLTIETKVNDETFSKSSYYVNDSKKALITEIDDESKVAEIPAK